MTRPSSWPGRRSSSPQRCSSPSTAIAVRSCWGSAWIACARTSRGWAGLRSSHLIGTNGPLMATPDAKSLFRAPFFRDGFQMSLVRCSRTIRTRCGQRFSSRPKSRACGASRWQSAIPGRCCAQGPSSTSTGRPAPGAREPPGQRCARTFLTYGAPGCPAQLRERHRSAGAARWPELSPSSMSSAVRDGRFRSIQQGLDAAVALIERRLDDPVGHGFFHFTPKAISDIGNQVLADSYDSYHDEFGTLVDLLQALPSSHRATGVRLRRAAQRRRALRTTGRRSKGRTPQVPRGRAQAQGAHPDVARAEGR